MGYSPWGRKELDTTKQLSTHKMLVDGELTQLCPTLCNPMSVGFSRQEYWSGLPFPSPGDLPNARIKPVSPALAGRFFTTSTSWEEVGEPKLPILCQVLHEYHLI